MTDFSTMAVYTINAFGVLIFALSYYHYWQSPAVKDPGFWRAVWLNVKIRFFPVLGMFWGILFFMFRQVQS